MDNIKIGKLISELRNKAKLTQQELGDKIGVGFRAVSKWECGQTLPELSNMKELSKIFGITLDELLSGKLKDKKKLAKIAKIGIGVSSIIVGILVTFLIIFNTKDKSYVYNLSSVDKEAYKIDGQITFSEENISIVISELKFRDENFASTKIINYEYSLLSNNKYIVGYGYSPTALFQEDVLTIADFCKNFKIVTTTEVIIQKQEFTDNNLYLDINFIDENNEIINQKIKIKSEPVK